MKRKCAAVLLLTQVAPTWALDAASTQFYCNEAKKAEQAAQIRHIQRFQPRRDPVKTFDDATGSCLDFIQNYNVGFSFTIPSIGDIDALLRDMSMKLMHRACQSATDQFNYAVNSALIAVGASIVPNIPSLPPGPSPGPSPGPDPGPSPGGGGGLCAQYGLMTNTVLPLIGNKSKFLPISRKQGYSFSFITGGAGEKGHASTNYANGAQYITISKDQCGYAPELAANHCAKQGTPPYLYYKVGGASTYECILEPYTEYYFNVRNATRDESTQEFIDTCFGKCTFMAF